MQEKVSVRFTRSALNSVKWLTLEYFEQWTGVDVAFVMRALFLESGITWVSELHNIAKSELTITHHLNNVRLEATISF